MSEDTPHDPSPKHLAQLLAQGQRPGPGQLPSAAAAAGAWVLVLGGVPLLASGWHAGAPSVDRVLDLTSAVVAGDLRALVPPGALALLGVLIAPLCAAALALGTAATLGGGTPQALTPDLMRFAGWRRWTGLQAEQSGWAAVRTVIPAAWVGAAALVLAALPYWMARHPAVCREQEPAPERCVQVALVAPIALVTLALSVALGVAALDVLAQRRQFRRQHRMTDDQLRREQKDAAPSSEVAAERRRLQQLQQLSVPRGVARADVILRNPTHVAVGLRYRAATHDAPVITVSGRERLASQILQEANRQGVPLVHLPACARALASLEPGDPLPAAWFDEVAHVYRWLADAGLVDLDRPDSDDDDSSASRPPRPVQKCPTSRP